MRATEFRIGNSVEYKFTNDLDERKQWWEETEIDVQDLLYISKNPNDKDYRPIPLTEEILLRYGFIKESKKLLFLPITKIKAEIHYERKNYGDVIVLKSDFGEFIPDDIKHIHQLQNLYFALTGQELVKK